MYIKLLYDLDQTITIKLFNNPAITKWFSRYSSSQYQQNYVNSSEYEIFRKTHQLIDPSYKTNNWNTILSTIQDLTSLGYRVPFEVPNEFTYDQDLLNQLHRFFTYNELWHGSGERNPYDPEFQTDLSFEGWHNILDKINVAVHSLEDITTNPNKKIIADQFPLEFFLLDVKEKSFNSVVEFDQDDQKLNFTYFNYQQHPLVLLDGSILGKSVFQSFLTDDDPSLKDCTGRLLSYGGFIIDLNNSRSKLYQSPEFLAWCDKFNLVSPPLEFPIGYVTNPEKLPIVKLLRFRRAVFGAG